MTEKEKMELLLKSIRGISDGHVSPEDAIDLCNLLVVALGAIRQHTQKYWAKLVLDSATVVIKDIAENIRNNTK
jgi:hypothetical protein